MRNAFADEILKLAVVDRRIVVLSGDIGNRLFDRFKMECPGRFYNCGIAEANMMSMAAGLASCGLRPVCYTITPFVTTRCLEQIKVDVCYHHVPVLIVGTGSGLSYASLGSTHHSFEDLAIMQVLPGMNVLAPGDSNELRACLRSSLRSSSPSYLRIGKKGEPIIYPEVPEFSFGKWREVCRGGDVALLAVGNMLPVALDVAKKLQSQVDFSVWGCASVKPLDEKFLAGAFQQYRVIVTLEEHAILGGFGSAVASWFATQLESRQPKLLCFGIKDQFMHEAGEQSHARRLFGIDADSVANTLQTYLRS